MDNRKNAARKDSEVSDGDGAASMLTENPPDTSSSNSEAWWAPFDNVRPAVNNVVI